MIILKFKLKCKICGKSKEWYVMPMKEKTKSNDYIRSATKYELVCKNCKQTYILKFNVEVA